MRCLIYWLAKIGKLSIAQQQQEAGSASRPLHPQLVAVFTTELARTSTVRRLKSVGAASRRGGMLLERCLSGWVVEVGAEFMRCGQRSPPRWAPRCIGTSFGTPDVGSQRTHWIRETDGGAWGLGPVGAVGATGAGFGRFATTPRSIRVCSSCSWTATAGEVATTNPCSEPNRSSNW